MFKASDGRHFVRIERLDGKEKPRVHWFSGYEHLEWLRVWSTHLGLSH